MEPATDENGGDQKQNQLAIVPHEKAAQNIAVKPRFLFGLKGDVRNNVYFLEDNARILYPCGHNVVIYHTDDRTQQYIPGIEGSEGITAMALSASKRYLAIAEKAERAIVCVWDLSNGGFKCKKKITSTDYQSKSFLSVAFAPGAEKSHLVTLTSEPDMKIIIWQWDKPKFLIQQQVPGISASPGTMQVSFHNTDCNVVLLTGQNCFKYYRMQDSQMKATHSAMTKKEASISNNYTCHLWLPDGKVLVCTDQGEILLLENGDYKFCLPESPGNGFYIECIQAYAKGFVIGGDNGTILVYDKSEEVKNPYSCFHTFSSAKVTTDRYPKLQAGIMASRVMCMALTSTDDTIVFTTNNNQMMALHQSLERPQEDAVYEYLIYPFHWRKIQGMDICLKKKLIATASDDRTVRIWNNGVNPPALEVCEIFQDEAYSAAFHPSGFHLIVGFTDRIRMLNLFKDELKEYNSINIKSCREIKFSHGGQMFAIAHLNQINVYKFYTGENTPDLCYKAHFGSVRCINWFDDDSGFISGGWDGFVYCWALYTDKNDKKQENPRSAFNIKNYQFSSVANLPDSKSLVYASGMDKKINVIDNGKLLLTYDAGVNISQLIPMHGGLEKAMLASVSESERPGSIQVINYAW